MVSKASPARRAAFTVLRDVQRGRGEPAPLLERARPGLSPADRDLATEIVYGVLRLRGALDYVLRHHARRPVAAIDDNVLTALRIGLYQLRYLDRIPPHAAVDESVRLARESGASKAAGFVNAVLRNVLRRPSEPPWPRKQDDPIAYLSETLSHPEWLVRRYLERLGLDGAEARCRRQNAIAPVFLRVSRPWTLAGAREALERESVATEPVPEVPRCLRVLSGRVHETTLHRDGAVFVQDAGSQLIPYLLEIGEQDLVLDVCAAPGGKATAMGEMAHRGRVLALDRRLPRARLVSRLSRRLKRDNVLVVAADGRRLPLRQPLARILLDVPCSSLGTLRRNPDIKWRVAEEDLRRFAEQQLDLLSHAAQTLTSEGRLVYATCSTEPEENEDVLRTFLERCPGMSLIPAETVLPPAARRFASPSGWLQTFPERDDMDGYFAAILAYSRDTIRT